MEPFAESASLPPSLKKKAEEVLENVYAKLIKLDSIFNANTDKISAENNNLKGLTTANESELERLNKEAGLSPLDVSPNCTSFCKFPS